MQYENEDDLDKEILEMLGQPAPESESAVEENLTTTLEATPETSESVAETISQESAPDNDEIQRLEKRVKDTQARMTQAAQEAADLRRSLAERDNRIQQLESMLQQQRQTEASSQDDDLSELETDYPEIAGPLVKRNKALEQKIAKLEQALTGVQQTTDRVVQSEQQQAAERHFSTIRQAHPDVESVVNSQDFGDWLQDQAPLVQYAIEQGSAQDVILALKLYKQSKGEPVQPVDKLAEAKKAATPNVPRNTAKPNSQQKTFTREQIAKMSIDEFMKYEADIDEALASGSVS